MASITTGYNDWTDLPSYDSDLDVSETNVVHGSGSMGGLLFNCQNWASTAVSFALTAGNITSYAAEWTADAAGAISVATVSWGVDPASPGDGMVFLPNLGPYVAVTASAFGTFTHSFYQWRSQRLVSPRWVCQTPYLFNQGNVTIGAGNTNTQFSQYVYGGPVQVRWGTAGQPGTLNIASVNLSLGYTTTSDGILLAANSTGRFQIVLPEGSHRLQIQNTGAASAIFSANVWPSVTGST